MLQIHCLFFKFTIGGGVGVEGMVNYNLSEICETDCNNFHDTKISSSLKIHKR